jgi:hypothetical protein
VRALLVILAALVAVPSAGAWHGMPVHWPESTVMVNEGGYTPSGHVVFSPSQYVPINEAWPSQGRPCVVDGHHECRLIHVRDRTGFGINWHTNVLVPRLKLVSAASGNRIVFRTSTASVETRVDSGPGATSSFMFAGKDGPGRLTVMRASQGSATGSTNVGCFYYGSTFLPIKPGWPDKPSYCHGNDDHAVWWGIAFNPSYQPGGSNWSRIGPTLMHELGHAALSLADTYNNPAYPFSDCGIQMGGDVSIMCANPVANDFFSAHDKATAALIYSHEENE